MNPLEIIRELGSKITTADVVVSVPGLVLFGVWLLRTSLGRQALADSPDRRNDMPFYLPFIPLFIGVGAVSLAIFAKEVFLTDLTDWQSVCLDNLILAVGAIAAIAVTLWLARGHFARRLKGFGLNLRAIHRDFTAAVLNLLTVYPLVSVALLATVFFGKLFAGPEFELPRHEQLEQVARHPQLSVRVLIVVTTIAIMPAFEEMVFRGMFQTMIRSLLSTFKSRSLHFLLRRPAWLAVTITSCLFAAVHANAGHWPALFVLAMCMGYSYEKSGSLFRPIFIHCVFNGISVLFALRTP